MAATGVARGAYRPDIDGLRAIAVALVVVYHAAPAWLPGGFVGVDVFFVISGYLISRIVVADIDAGRFTFRRFYERRARRIFPALSVVMAAIAAFGWLFLLPEEWSQLGRDLAAGASFVSNLAFARDAVGYFEPTAHLKPLMHLWSLGVEEQFYAAWPIVLLLISRLSARPGLVLLALLVILSFALNLDLVAANQRLAFFLPFTRLWELAAGAVLTFCEVRFPRSASRVGVAHGLSIAGLLLCVTAAVIAREDSFPGAWALLPVAGSAMLVAAGSNAVVNRKFLSARVMVAVGLISYPLYLWHWPMLSFVRIWCRELPAVLAASCVVLALFASWATFVYVEVPIRSRTAPPRRLALVCTAIVLIGALGVGARYRTIAPRVDTPAARNAAATTADWTYPFDNFGRLHGFERSTVAGDPRRVVLFVGDSHVEQYWPRLDDLSRTANVAEMRFVTNSGCPPLRGLPTARKACDEFLDFAIHEAQDPSVNTVVFGAAWFSYLKSPATPLQRSTALLGFERTIRVLTRRGKRVYVILGSPHANTFDPILTVSRVDGGYREPEPIAAAVFRDRTWRSIEQVALRAGAKTIDPLPALCPNGLCRGAVDGLPLYRDPGHIRASYARGSARFLDDIVRVGDSPTSPGE